MSFHQRWGHFVAVTILGLAATVSTTNAQLPFSAPRNVSNNLDSTFTPQTAVDSAGNIFVVWEDDTNTNANILFSRSSESGETFSTTINLSHSRLFPLGPRISVDSQDGNNVVLNDNSSCRLDIF